MDKLRYLSFNSCKQSHNSAFDSKVPFTENMNNLAGAKPSLKRPIIDICDELQMDAESIQNAYFIPPFAINPIKVSRSEISVMSYFRRTLCCPYCLGNIPQDHKHCTRQAFRGLHLPRDVHILYEQPGTLWAPFIIMGRRHLLVGTIYSPITGPIPSPLLHK